MKFLVIIPAFNEEQYIRKCLDSILDQSLRPNELIVVNDGSTDFTAQIVMQYSKQSEWIRLVENSAKPVHEPGAKIVRAFKKGLGQAKTDWGVVFKLDADVILPSTYFETVIDVMQNQTKTGMAGGLVFSKKGTKWKQETISDKDHLRGPIKSYHRSCYKAINGLRESIGWDTVDEILSVYHGFQIKILPQLVVRVQKPTGFLYQTKHAQLMGLSMYKMRYGFVISAIAATKIALNQKNFLILYRIMKSYTKNYFDKVKPMVTSEEGKFIRNYRWSKIKKKLTAVFL